MYKPSLNTNHNTKLSKNVIQREYYIIIIVNHLYKRIDRNGRRYVSEVDTRTKCIVNNVWGQKT